MSYSKNVWNQLKNLTADDFIRALGQDGWEREEKSGAILPYIHEDGRRITIHYHSKMTYGPRLIKGLLRDIGWTEDDMKRVGLI